MKVRWWHDIPKFQKAIGIAISLISIGCALGLFFALNAVDQVEQAAETAKDTASKVELETEERVDDVCRLHENTYLIEVDGLRDRYKYLRKLPQEETGSGLTTFVIADLPDAVQEAEASIPPAFCHPEEVGLSKRVPEIVELKEFNELLEKKNLTVE